MAKKKVTKTKIKGEITKILSRTIITQDKGATLREINEIKNFIKARKGDNSICIASPSMSGDKNSSYLYIFDVKPKLVVRISDHDTRMVNVEARTTEKIKTETEVVEVADKWEMFHEVLDVTKKIK